MRFASRRSNSAKNAIAAIAPATKADKSRMKTTAHTPVGKVIPTNAKNAAFLRLMVEIAPTGFTVALQPSNVAVLINPVNGTPERLTEGIRHPPIGKIGRDCDRNSVTSEGEGNGKGRIDGSI